MASVLSLSILLESLSLPAVLADTHTLHHYFTTIWSQSWSGPPQTEVVVSLDDAPILKYSSSTFKLQFLNNWLESIYGEHWGILEQKAKYYVHRHQHTIRRLPSFKNDTDFFVFQVKFSCYIYEDNSTGGEEEFGVNGGDFIFLDNKKRMFMASVTEGKALALEWNKRHKSAQRQFHYKDVACVQWMRDYLSIRNEQKVRPEVEVRGRISGEKTRLHCLVYGFHPKDIIVKWVRNGVDDVPTDKMSPILPHPDGTYQIRVSAEVPTREGDTYSCHVDHSSLEEPLNVKMVRPEVEVRGRISGEKTRLHCLVYGFHPKDIIVKWVRNGVDDVPTDKMSPILPHPDGTYQIRVSAEVPTREGDTYSCHVDHSSLEEPLNVNLGADQIYGTDKEKIKARHWIISSALIFVGLLVVFVVVYLRISGRKIKAITEPD